MRFGYVVTHLEPEELMYDIKTIWSICEWVMSGRVPEVDIQNIKRRYQDYQKEIFVI